MTKELDEILEINESSTEQPDWGPENTKLHELQEYVLKAEGLSRKGLNIMCFIGVFIFGVLLGVAFDMLGKKRQGWFYLVPIIGCLVISRQAAHYPATSH